MLENLRRKNSEIFFNHDEGKERAVAILENLKRRNLKDIFHYAGWKRERTILENLLTKICAR